MYSGYAKYARGFLLLPKETNPLDVPSYWLSEKFKDYTLFHDPRVKTAKAGETLFIGNGVHIPSGTFFLSSIVEELDSVRDISFDSAVDDLCGRFVVVSERDGGLWVRQDATGMRQAYHTEVPGGTALASHSRLAAIQASRSPSEYAGTFRKDNGLDAFPGRTTYFQDVWNLLPATEMDLRSGAVRRFYFGPSEVRQLTVEEAAQILIRNAHAQRDYLLQRKPLHVSLTAGIDSRTTLALIRSIVQDIELFSYVMSYREGSDIGDDEIPMELAARFGLRHRLLTITAPGISPEDAEIFNTNFPGGSHLRNVALQYQEQIPFGVHLRSNIYEGAVSQFRRHGYKDVDEITPEVLSAISSRRRSTHPLLLKAWAEYLETTDFAAIRNIDPLTLFFFEHRMGSWLHPVYMEADIAHDVHTLINHRPTLEAINSVSYDERVTEAVQVQAIKCEWPELLEIPVNGKLRS